MVFWVFLRCAFILTKTMSVFPPKFYFSIFSLLSSFIYRLKKHCTSVLNSVGSIPFLHSLFRFSFAEGPVLLLLRKWSRYLNGPWFYACHCKGGRARRSFGAKEWHEQKHRRRRMQWKVESSHLALS